MRILQRGFWLGLALVSSSVIAVQAADTVVEHSVLTGGERVRLEDHLPVQFAIELDGTFRSIERVTVIVFMVDDLMAAGERLDIRLDRGGYVLSHGFPTPQRTRSLSTTAESGFKDALLDGESTLELEARYGTMTLEQVVLEITGDFLTDAGTAVRAEKSDQLVVDWDGDQLADPGDVLQYTVHLYNSAPIAAQGMVLTDVPDRHSALVPGSVNTTLGSVVVGNDPLDEIVVVEIGELRSLDRLVTIEFRVEIDDPLPADLLSLTNQATVTGDNFDDQVSNDPDTGAGLDPTATPLENEPLDRFERALDTCEEDRSDLEATLELCEAELSALEGDEDADGVLDLVDRCGGSGAAEEVDALGCSLAQFCHGAGVEGGWFGCWLADWKNDEPIRPRDCRRVRSGCAPSLERRLPGRSAHDSGGRRFGR